jgi:hypothetical protein
MKQTMPADMLRGEIKKFLKKREELVLCTCNDNIPRATPMEFYTDKTSFDIYVGLAPGWKVTNIEKNPMVSIGIYTPMKEGKVQGMQITASGSHNVILLRKSDEGFEAAQRIVRGKRKIILRIIPEIIELLDYDFVKQGYARSQRLEL